MICSVIAHILTFQKHYYSYNLNILKSYIGNVTLNIDMRNKQQQE